MNTYHHELMTRMAATLRRDVGPQVTDDYARTQAFLAAVVLEKLSNELLLGPEHAELDRRDAEALFTAVAALVGAADVPDVPDALSTALAEGPASADPAAALSRLVQALYASREALGGATFETAHTLVRATLRARIDRQLAYSA